MKKLITVIGLACGMGLFAGCNTTATAPARVPKTITVTVSPVEATVRIIGHQEAEIARGQTFGKVALLTIAVPATRSAFAADFGMATVIASAPGYHDGRALLRYQDESSVKIEMLPTNETRVERLNALLKEALPLFLKEEVDVAISGTATLSGQAFLKTRGGEVKIGAGNTITAVRAGSLAKEILGLIKQGADAKGVPAEAIDKLALLTRSTQADAQGGFEFKNMPAGKYIISTSITWEVPGRYGTETTGGEVEIEASVADGESKRVMLTR